MKKVILKIKNMDCASCVIDIDGILAEQKGIKGSMTNFAKSQTQVEYNDAEISPKAILAFIQKAGFTAEVQNKV
jgi:copper chaperone CopZ